MDASGITKTIILSMVVNNRKGRSTGKFYTFLVTRVTPKINSYQGAGNKQSISSFSTWLWCIKVHTDPAEKNPDLLV